jgi:hypothetical protein
MRREREREGGGFATVEEMDGKMNGKGMVNVGGEEKKERNTAWTHTKTEGHIRVRHAMAELLACDQALLYPQSSSRVSIRS